MKNFALAKKTLISSVFAILSIGSVGNATYMSSSQYSQGRGYEGTQIDDVNCDGQNPMAIPGPLKSLQEIMDGEIVNTSPRTILNKSKIAELKSFYTTHEFPRNIIAEIASNNWMAAVNINEDNLQDVFPKTCDTLIDQVAETVKVAVMRSSRLMLRAEDGGPKDIASACPRWNSLVEDDRRDFYIGLVTAMAMAESTCNNNARNGRASDGVAYGYWQGRKKMSPQAGAEWVIRQIDSQVKQSGLLFWNNSNRNYWAVLNPNIHAYKVQKLLKKIPACFVEAISGKN
jgi:hypothetical protein